MFLRKFSLIGVLLVTSIISALIARSEFLTLTGTQSNTFLLSLLDTPLSLKGNKRMLDHCVVELNKAELLVLPMHEFTKTVGGCHSVAVNTSRRLPTFSYAWVLRGLTELLLKQDATAVDAFKTSHELSSKELWISRLRLQTLLRFKSEFLYEPKLIEQNIADVEVLIYGNRDWRMLAVLWVNSEMKEHIAKLVKTLPADKQQRFLRSIRQNFTSTPKS